jgi:Flp pilus assembly protein TadG
MSRAKFPSSLNAFSRDEGGTVAILFALTIVVVLSLVGGAIDYGRAVHARYQIQEAVDSAVLAAARVWQTENDINLAQEKGLVHYNNNKPLTFSSQVSKFTPDFTANTISMEAKVWCRRRSSAWCGMRAIRWAPLRRRVCRSAKTPARASRCR